MKILINACFVAGVCHRNADLTEVAEGTPVTFEPESTNPYDPNAIIVRDPKGQNIGYIPAVGTAPLHNALAAGWPLSGQVVERRPTKHKEIAIYVYAEITSEDISDGVEEEEEEGLDSCLSEQEAPVSDQQE